MTQTLLLILIFTAATVYLARFVIRQANVGQNDAKCDKCLPENQPKRKKSLP
jgi:hypothetical protein